MTDETSLADERWVRIDCLHSSDGVWDRRGVACSADELPVPADLVARIRRWATWFDTSGIPIDPDPTFDFNAFAAEGRAIARAVKAVLPDWTVVDLHDDITLPEAPPAP